MNFRMPCQIVLTRKGLSTFKTLVTSFSTMTLLVVFLNLFPGKTLPADRTRKRCFGLFSNHVVEALRKITDLGMKGSGVSGVALIINQSGSLGQEG